ncbi:hypothetical protein HMF8227_01198 [Saliniradius amylolyticus]|uniref:TIGR03016 family PEP-CTERM system-associated outer membrane protein n=1 Tax=Saliniradius amylolyticus TaxID=2183582 RepID=A0A2S2E256_9ALTE|nr:hypothetical protein [Saliniradius amylolyticus]AWL11679.1 hypothetical protein HMF8227_01198 [Saliniradius amylolyticus]
MADKVKQPTYRLLCLLSTMALPVSGLAGELMIQPALEVLSSHPDIDDRTTPSQSRDGLAWSLTPELGLEYHSNRTRVNFITRYQHIERHGELTSSGRSNGDWSTTLSSTVDIVKDALQLAATYDRSQQLADSRTGVFSDKLTAPDDFVDVESYSGNLSWQIPNAKWVSMNGSLFGSRRTTVDDVSDGDFFNVDSERLGGQMQLSNGYQYQYLQWQLQASEQETRRRQLGDFKQQALSANMDIPLYGELSLTLTAQDTNYSLDGNQILADRLDYQQYGIGLGWQLGQNSVIKIIAYRSDQNQEQTDDNYIGGLARLVLSPRSSIEYEKSKNALGDKESLTLIQNSRLLRTRVGFSEDIRISTTTELAQTGTATFVCSDSSTDINDCFLPSTLDYQLAPGEALVSFNQLSPELNEQVAKLETAFISLSYDNQSKLLMSVGYSHSKRVGLESATRDEDRDSYSANLSYRVAPYSAVILSANISQIDFITLNESDDNRQFALSYDTALSPDMDLKLSAVRRERKVDERQIDFTDDRLELVLNYRF